MTTLTNPIGIPLAYGMFMTYSVELSGSGYITEWWVSSRTVNYARVVAHLSIPVFGETIGDAQVSAARLATIVEDFILTSWSGQGIPSGHAPIEHVLAHMEHHAEHLNEDALHQTIGLYELLSGFKVNNPAVLIAEKMNVPSVRTVQDRIARARKDGLIPKFGQGKTHA